MCLCPQESIRCQTIVYSPPPPPPPKKKTTNKQQIEPYLSIFPILTGASSCKAILTQELGKADGEYSLQLDANCKIPIRVYCHGMNTLNPKEYLTLPSGQQNNFAIVYKHRLPTSPVFARYRCDVKPSDRLYSKAGVTRFSKVRLDIKKMKIVPDDYTFATIEAGGKPVEFGTAGDCFSASAGSCRKGSFKIDLTNTGLSIDKNVKWISTAFPPGIKMQGYYRSGDGHVVSANCGGWCGHCGPSAEMKIEQKECLREEGKYVIFR